MFFCTGNKGKILEITAMLQSTEKVIGIQEIQKSTQFEYDEPNEDSNLFVANGLAKLLSAYSFFKESKIEQSLDYKIEKIVVDDSGLCVPKLNFEPGVHSATYGGLPRSDANNRKALSQTIKKSKDSFDFENEKRLDGFFVCFLFEISNNNLFLKPEKNASFLVNKNTIEFEKKLFEKILNNKNLNSFSIKEKLLNLLPDLKIDLEIIIHCGYCFGEVSHIEQNLIEGAGHGYDSMFYPLENKKLSFASITLSEKNKKSHRGFAIQQIIK